MKGFFIKIKDKIKEICNKEYLKNNMDKVIIFGVVFVLLIGILIYYLITRSVSKIEENKLKEKSNDLITYIEDISLSKSKEIDKYIIFALDYSYNVNAKNKMTSEEISDFLSKNFTKKISAEDIKKMGVSPLMLERDITYDSSDDSYKLNNPNKSAKKIAETEIVYYKIEKIRKFNTKKYTITYRKYIIEDPYKMLNYYIDNNSSDKKGEVVDYTIIRNYLMGSGKILDVKNFIREHEKDLKKYAKKKGKLKVTYVSKNGDNLLISSIK
jgi:hypothetical protein